METSSLLLFKNQALYINRRLGIAEKETASKLFQNPMRHCFKQGFLEMVTFAFLHIHKLFKMEAGLTATYVLRLHPGHDLRAALEAYAKAENLHAAWIVTGVGSLTQTHLRFANQKTGTKATGHFEIVSLTGTVSAGGCHLHICVADGAGLCTGGHLLYENLIYTTAEIVIGSSAALSFTRAHDPATGCKELKVETAPGK